MAPAHVATPPDALGDLCATKNITVTYPAAWRRKPGTLTGSDYSKAAAAREAVIGGQSPLSGADGAATRRFSCALTVGRPTLVGGAARGGAKYWPLRSESGMTQRAAAPF